MASTLPTSSSSSSRALILTRSPNPSPSPTPIDRSRSTVSTVLPAVAQSSELWQPILRASNQVVLYNPRSHALSIASAPTNVDPAVVVARRPRVPAIAGDVAQIGRPCPYCKQSLPEGFHGYHPPPIFEHAGNVEEVGEGSEWDDVVHTGEDGEDGEYQSLSTDPAYHSRASDYFRLLAIANNASSQTSGSRRSSLSPSFRVRREEEGEEEGRRGRSRGKHRARTRTPEAYRSEKGAFPAEKMAEGYFKTFFQEESKLGMGASGTVYLCQHVLDGNALGHFAVKKIAVGESHSYLVKILREVRLLERLRHPNIITYHHAWLENAQFSSFGPQVPTLHVLMQWAEGGSLDDFIDVRLGRKAAHIHVHPVSAAVSASASALASPASTQGDLPSDDHDYFTSSTPMQTTSPATSKKPQHASSKPDDLHSRSARIRAFRAYQRAPPEEKERMRAEMEGGDTNSTAGATAGGAGQGPSPDPNGQHRQHQWTAVHLLSAEEMKSLFQDVVEGLGFLHSKAILHLDLKPGNVLLTWDEGCLIPRAMLSDFGTSRDMIHSSLRRSGNTGTLEYTAPESLPSPQTGLLQQIDSKADMWSLGMILHKLLFFKLPYRYASEGDANGEAISRDEEGEKMDRLEREVLNYIGFKSTPAAVTGFEARRLPRAFLVLLESLLNKSPAGRPSCERVSAAIREGKLNPLQANASTNLPLARPASNKGSPAATPDEKAPLLALPSPEEVLGLEESHIWGSWFGASYVRDLHSRRRRRVHGNTAISDGWSSTSLKLFRSSLLAAKVLTIPRICPSPLLRPRTAVAAALVVLALVDSVVDHRDFQSDWIGREGSDRNGDEGRGRGREDGRAESKRHGEGGRWTKVWNAARGARVSVSLAVLHFGLVALGVSASTSSGSDSALGSVGQVVCRICCAPLVDGRSSFGGGSG